MDSWADDGPAPDEHGLASRSQVELAEELRGLGAETFRERYPCAFLVLTQSPPSDEIGLDLRTFVGSVDGTSGSTGPSGGQRIVPLRKTDRNAFDSKITVGRARNNDVIIRAQRISKLHACFYRDRKGRYSLQDMGSLNGTQVNGQRLEKKKCLDLATGDAIAFWRYRFEFVDLDAMIDRLAAGE